MVSEQQVMTSESKRAFYYRRQLYYVLNIVSNNQLVMKNIQTLKYILINASDYLINK